MENFNKICFYGEENILLCKCDFCKSNAKTYNFDITNNITKEEANDNDINLQLYDLHFTHKICSVCREKNLKEIYSEL